MAEREAYSPFGAPAAGEFDLGGDGRRSDGRTPENLRPPVLQTGTVSQATGSGYIELGGTKVLCGVYGPREVGKETYSEEGRVKVDVKYATFAAAVRGKFGQSTEERLLSSQLHQALRGAILAETFPKATVDVFVLILEAKGGELPAAVLAASMALAHAGVAMRDLVTCCSLARIKGVLYLDPMPAELAAADATATVAVMSRADEVTQMLLSGEWEGDASTEAFELCIDGCAMLDEALRESLRQQTATARVGQSA